MNTIVRRIASTLEDSPGRSAAVLTVLAAATAVLAPVPSSAGEAAMARPTVVLVHGAFAESSSWNGVAAKLLAQGFPVVAAANPLRGVKSDASSLAGVLDSIKGPIVLVGHSYGGTVITNAASGKSQVTALVYVAAFAPELGETSFALAGRFPGATLGPTLAAPVLLADGAKDLYIRQDKFWEQFAADVPKVEAKLMAATQRPIAEAAGNEASGSPAWKTIPSFFIWGSADKNIPAAAQVFMAQRAGARKVVEVKGASHVVMTSHPREVARLIVEAAGPLAVVAKH
jgi:pimeloyl-ACP methyl ester carboxylesterase